MDRGMLGGLLKNIMNTPMGTNMLNMVFPGVISRFEAARTRLDNQTFHGEAGAGMVKASFKGSGEMVSLRIDPAIIGKVHMVEDLTVVAVNEARKQIKRTEEETMREVFQSMESMVGEAMFAGKKK